MDVLREIVTTYIDCKFVLDKIIDPFVSAFFTVIGGAIPLAFLIYFFSREKKKRLAEYADSLEKTIPLQEQLLDRMADLIKSSINQYSLTELGDQFKQFAESKTLVEQNKRFIKYARDYNFITAIGQILRMGNYFPKNISEHKEIMDLKDNTKK